MSYKCDLRGAVALLSMSLLATALGGCAATQLLERQSTTLAKADLGADDRYATAVSLPQVPPKSMHEGIIGPLAHALADTLAQTLGVSAVAVDHAQNSPWREAQRALDAGDTGQKRRFYQRKDGPNYAPFFRDRAFNGYVLLTLAEGTDGSSRNELDYSLRGTLSIHSLGESDDGEPTATLLSRVGLSPTVCSRRLKNPPKTDAMIVYQDGYQLSNPERCVAILRDKLREQLENLLR